MTFLARFSLGALPSHVRMSLRTRLAVGGGWTAPHPGWGVIARVTDKAAVPRDRPLTDLEA
jgi:hypothetical protein